MFGKILAIVLLVLVISFALTGLLMNSGLNRMITDQKAQQLESTSDKVIAALEMILKSAYNRDPSLLVNAIQTLADNTDSIIWITRTDGTIVFFSEIPDYMRDQLITSEDGFPRLPNPSQYDPLAEKYRSGDFYGLFKKTDVDWLTLTEAFSITNPYTGTRSGGLIFIHTQIPAIYGMKRSILFIFLASGTVGAAIALIAVTLLSRRTIRPLNRIKHAARMVAAGEFSERIPVKGKDEISELADSFNHMMVALENLERMRRDFIGNVSHELRTPITTIKGFVEGILDGVIPVERQADYLMIVRDEIRRMQNLVNELLDLARMQGGEVTLKPSNFDMNELIRRCVIGLQQMFIEKNLGFKANFESERMFVHADPDAIQRVLINLIHNAIKFTPQGGEITVSTWVERDKAFISVEDTGKGISAEELPYIFERFYKTDKSRSADRTGLGLGLAIVRSIIVSHNESIKVESQEGRGTRFIFTLRSVTGPESY
jgi:signal transduction histidine kinase